MYYSLIKPIVENNWAEIEASQYPEDLLTEWADSAVPIYTINIIRAWYQDLPSVAMDAWRDTGLEVSPETTIVDLMKIDLYLHLEGLYNRAYSEILATKEGN
jgi:hypothetical protein